MMSTLHISLTIIHNYYGGDEDHDDDNDENDDVNNDAMETVLVVFTKPQSSYGGNSWEC